MADGVIESVFAPRRLFLLLKRDLVNGYRGLLITIAAVGGTMIVISFLTALCGARGADIYTPYYYGFLVLGGLIYTSVVFKEMHQVGTGPFYLTLPGSRLEKFASKLLVSSVGFAAGTIIFIAVAAGISELLNRAVFGARNIMFNPLGEEVLMGAAVYIVCQAAYLLGSVWFRKLAFLKTALTISVLSIFLMLFAGLVFRLVFSDYFMGWNMTSAGEAFLNRWFETKFPSGQAVLLWAGSNWLAITLKVLWWGCAAPVCWVIAFIRLGETEA
jgi:hypothetical protein